MVVRFATIAITPHTKTKLNEIGKKGETYDQIILKLLEKKS